MLPNEINISSDRFLIIEHPEITIPRKPSFLRRLEQTISSIVAWPRGRQTWKSVFFLVQTRGFEMQQEQGRGEAGMKARGRSTRKISLQDRSFLFLSLFFFFFQTRYVLDDEDRGGLRTENVTQA